MLTQRVPGRRLGDEEFFKLVASRPRSCSLAQLPERVRQSLLAGKVTIWACADYVYREPEESRDSSEPVLPQRTRDYLAHGVPKGQRNNELFEAAGQLRDAGYSRAQVDALVIPRAAADGLSAAEIDATLNSVFQRGPRSPIHGKNSQEPPRSSPPATEPGVALPPPIADGLKLLLETCFEENENVAISDTKLNASGEPKPLAGHCYSREAWLKRLQDDPISKVYSAARDGLFIRINPLCRRGSKDEHVTAFRHVLVEWDGIPKEVQYAILLKSGLPITLTELLECLREVQNRNGFSNRVLWMATKRVKKVPLPIWIDWKKKHPEIVKNLKDILLNIGAVTSREMGWSQDGEKAWKQFYKKGPRRRRSFD